MLVAVEEELAATVLMGTTGVQMISCIKTFLPRAALLPRRLAQHQSASSPAAENDNDQVLVTAACSSSGCMDFAIGFLFPGRGGPKRSKTQCRIWQQLSIDNFVGSVIVVSSRWIWQSPRSDTSSCVSPFCSNPSHRG